MWFGFRELLYLQVWLYGYAIQLWLYSYGYIAMAIWLWLCSYGLYSYGLYSYGRELLYLQGEDRNVLRGWMLVVSPFIGIAAVLVLRCVHGTLLVLCKLLEPLCNRLPCNRERPAASLDQNASDQGVGEQRPTSEPDRASHATPARASERLYLS